MKKLIIFIFLFVGCARMPVTERTQAMRKADKLPEIYDDLKFDSLISGLQANIDFVKKSTRMGAEVTFGPTKVNKKVYLASLQELANNAKNIDEFKALVAKNFDFYEVYGNEDWSKIKTTSYYSPLLKASKTKTKSLYQPLYTTPDDMISIDIDAYAEDFPKWKTFKEKVLEQRSSKALARGRIVTDKNGSIRIVPYFKRADIDEKDVINSKKHALAYVDPVKAFFLQIQGSGVLEFEDGKQITVGYASQNGHPYVAIGSKLLDRIPKEKMSMQNIEAYLYSLNQKDMQSILNLNPSYVFFQEMKSRPQSYLGTEVVDGRTVATDQSLFPKGTLAFLKFEKPVFESLKNHEPIAWQPSSRFVFDQDTGGAIRGPGRLDLYAGSGEEAEQFAGVMKNPAQLYYLVPKSDYIKILENSTN
jgi:membrane-bound lytic murein transglycosylase A